MLIGRSIVLLVTNVKRLCWSISRNKNCCPQW